VEKIKKGFRDEGIIKDWDPQSRTGNPAVSKEVMSYLKFVKEEQGKAGVVPKQAQVILKDKLKLLLQEMDKDRFSSGNPPKRFLEITRDCAIFSVTFGAMKRGDCISKFISKNTMRMPNNKGLVFNFTWGKTLRGGTSHMFGIECTCKELEKDLLCSPCRIDEWVKEAKSWGWKFEEGYLFSPVVGELNFPRRGMGEMGAKLMTDNLRNYLKKYGMFEKETMHSFRSGGAIARLLEGEPLEEVMYKAYWKSKETAMHYTKILQVLCPKGFKWDSIRNTEGLSYNDIDNLPKSLKSDFWRAF
jgi:hypothetical protein